MAKPSDSSPPLEARLDLEFDRFDSFVDIFRSNISLGGLFVETPDPRSVGTEIRFQMKLSDGYQLLRGIGEVEWVRPRALSAAEPPGMAIRFLALDESSRTLVLKLMEEQLESGGEPFEIDAVPEGAHAESAAPAQLELLSEEPTIVGSTARAGTGSLFSAPWGSSPPDVPVDLMEEDPVGVEGRTLLDPTSEDPWQLDTPDPPTLVGGETTERSAEPAFDRPDAPEALPDAADDPWASVDSRFAVAVSPDGDMADVDFDDEDGFGDTVDFGRTEEFEEVARDEFEPEELSPDDSSPEFQPFEVQPPDPPPAEQPATEEFDSLDFVVTKDLSDEIASAPAVETSAGDDAFAAEDLGEETVRVDRTRFEPPDLSGAAFVPPTDPMAPSSEEAFGAGEADFEAPSYDEVVVPAVSFEPPALESPATRAEPFESAPSSPPAVEPAAPESFAVAPAAPESFAEPIEPTEPTEVMGRPSFFGAPPAAEAVDDPTMPVPISEDWDEAAYEDPPAPQPPRRRWHLVALLLLIPLLVGLYLFRDPLLGLLPGAEPVADGQIADGQIAGGQIADGQIADGEALAPAGVPPADDASLEPEEITVELEPLEPEPLEPEPFELDRADASDSRGDSSGGFETETEDREDPVAAAPSEARSAPAREIAAPAPAVASAPPAAIDTRPASSVQAMSWEAVPGGTRVVVELDGGVASGRVLHDTLSWATDRESITLLGVERTTRDVLRVDTPALQRVRVGRHPGELRLVFDLAGTTARITEVTPRGSRLEVLISDR